MTYNLKSICISLAFITLFVLHDYYSLEGAVNIMRLVSWALLLLMIVSFIAYIAAQDWPPEKVLEHFKRPYQFTFFTKMLAYVSHWGLVLYMAWIGIVWSAAALGASLLLAYLCRHLREDLVKNAEAAIKEAAK